MSARVNVLGGTTFDLFAPGLPYLPRADDAGDEFTQFSLVHVTGGFVPSVGGNAGNTAFVAARLGGRHVHLVTALGDDLFARWLRERFAEVGVELTIVPPAATSVNVVATDAEHRRISLFRPVRVDTDAVVALAARVPGSGERDRTGRDVVLLTGYPHAAPEALAAWARVGHERGAIVALDVGPSVARLSEHALTGALPHVDLLLANRLELQVLVPRLDAEAAARHLAELYGTAVVIKEGQRGTTYITTREEVHVAAYRVGQAGPTVGAGDAFNAGLLHRLAEDASPADALRFGAAVAATVVERGRGVSGAPAFPDVEEFMGSHSPVDTNLVPDNHHH